LPRYRHFSGDRRRNVAGHYCQLRLDNVGDSPAHVRIWTMTWSHGTAGSDSRTAPAVPSRLVSAAATSVTIGALSPCVVITQTVLSIKVTMAMPRPT
jgi:hypothetical protein